MIQHKNMEETDESTDGMNNMDNDSTSSHDIIVEDLDEEDAEVYERGSEKWYSITILILAVVGLAINITAVIIMRKKKGIFHTMLKVSHYDKHSDKSYLLKATLLKQLNIPHQHFNHFDNIIKI